MNSSDLFEAKKNLQTLYVSRKLTNAEDLVAWAHEQGFDKCLDPKEMHVTIAYSKEKIDVSEMTDSFDTVNVAAKKGNKGGKREMKLFGEKKDCVVLVFECPDLHHRWEEFIDDFGASWDHDGYHPHVTISYNGLPEGLELKDIEPYKGRLEFGPEVHQEINPKWKSKAKEKKTKPKKIDESELYFVQPDGTWKAGDGRSKGLTRAEVEKAGGQIVEAKTGTDTERAARKFAADVARFGRSIGIKVEWRHPFAHAEGEIELTGLSAKETGTGAGTKLMTFMGDLADEAGVNVYVQPGSWRNRDFYTRFGFNKSGKGSGLMVRYAALDPETQEEMDAIRARDGLVESKPAAGKLEPTRENLARAQEFVLKKWRERATERGYPEPDDLSSSCKFTSLFVQAIFGGQIRGNYEHQYVVLNGEIIDLNKDAADVRSMEDPHEHDESWFGNADHLDSMESCKPRVKDWVREFQASLNESFTLNSLDTEGVDRLVASFRKSYEAQTGSSWAEDKIVDRARNWTFYGDEDGYLAVRVQASGMKKMVAVAGDPKSVLKGMKELQAEGGPIWGAVSGELATMAKKRGMIVPHLIPGGAALVKAMAAAIPSSVFGGVKPTVNDNGGVVLDYEDVGSTVKYFVGNKDYFQSALKLPLIASKISSVPGLKQVIGLLGLKESETSTLFYGTSTGALLSLRESDYAANHIRLVKNPVAAALEAAAKDGTDPIIIEVDAGKLVGELGLADDEDQFTYTGSLREAVIRYRPWDQGGEIEAPLTESAATNWPTVRFEELYHVGTLNAADKRKGSLEGAGLSVSRHPESWSQIAEISGDVWRLTKEGNAFLNFHMLKPEQRQLITNWGVQHRFVTYGEHFTVEFFNEDAEETQTMEFDTFEDAKDEVEYLGLDPSNIKHVDGVLKPTPKLLTVTNQGQGAAFDLLTTVYVESMLPFDGIWWADRFEPWTLSAPRGVIVPKHLPSWKVERDDEARDADDGDDFE